MGNVMATGNFHQCLALVLKEEGGFVNDPQDPGGITNFGVTKKTFEEWVGHEVTEDDMRGLDPSDVEDLYRQRYWDVVHGDGLPDGVDYAVMDCGVNSGTHESVKLLQRVLQLTDDGVIGPVTLQAANAADAADTINKLCDARLAFLQTLHNWDHDGHGWSNRIAFVREMALKMVG
jgi:lysozyme family protein